MQEFFPEHSNVLTALRHALVPAALQAHAESLAAHITTQLKHLSSSTTDLYELVKGMVFQAAAECLFGRAFIARHGCAALQEAFFEFESGFEMAASPVPHLFQPRFVKSRRTLVTSLRESFEKGDFEGTVVGQLFAG